MDFLDFDFHDDHFAYDEYYDNVRKPNDGLELLEFPTEPKKHETEKAILVDFRGVDVWIPKSQIVHRDGKTFLPRWLVDRKIEEVSR